MPEVQLLERLKWALRAISWFKVLNFHSGRYCNDICRSAWSLQFVQGNVVH